MTAVLHVISDSTRHQLPLRDALIASAKGGADVLQIREKRAPAAETFSFCSDLRAAMATCANVPEIYVNDRVDIAIAASLQGVHLARLSLPISAVLKLRTQSNWRGVIGVSVHSLDEARAAEAAGADYVTFGHVYASESHRGQPARGLLALARVVEALCIPVIAIGGIDVRNVDPVLDTGCSGIAVIGAVLDSAHPQAATQALKERIVASTTKPKFSFPIGGVGE